MPSRMKSVEESPFQGAPFYGLEQTCDEKGEQNNLLLDGFSYTVARYLLFTSNKNI